MRSGARQEIAPEATNDGQTVREVFFVSSHRRLSRRERRQQTTERLLSAGSQLFARNGFGGVSVEAIAAAAGYSRGAFYSNFATKEELFIELLRRDRCMTQAKLDTADAACAPLPDFDLRMRHLCGHLWRDRESLLNWTEARVRAARDPDFRAKFRALLLDRGSAMADLIAASSQDLNVEPAVPAITMAAGLMTVCEAIGLFALSNPVDLTPGDAERLLSAFMACVMQPARPRSPQ